MTRSTRFPLVGGLWLSLALIAVGCGNSDPSDAKLPAGESGGEGGYSGAGAAGALTGGSAGGCQHCGPGTGGVGGAFPECKPGSWKPSPSEGCKPWTTCSEAETELSAPTDTADRVCAQLEFVDLFGGEGEQAVIDLALNSTGEVCVAASDGQLRKYAPDGALAWSSDVTDPELDVLPVAVGIDAAGNCYAAGSTPRPSPSQPKPASEWFVRKFDGQGQTVWNAQGSTDSRTPADLAVDPSGNVLVGFVSFVPAGYSESNALVAKYDSAGMELWAKEYDYPGRQESHLGVDDAGDVVVAGTTFVSGASPEDSVSAFALKLSTAGETLWESQYPSAQLLAVSDLDVRPDGRAWICGAKSPGFVTAFKLTPAGVGSVVSLGDGCSLLTEAGPDDLWAAVSSGVVRYAADGTVKFSQRLGPVSVTALAARGNVVVVGGQATAGLAGKPFGGGASDAFILRIKVE